MVRNTPNRIGIMKYFFTSPFVVILFWVIFCAAQDAPQIPPHRSAIAPPVILMDRAILRRFPTNTFMVHVPVGKVPEMYFIGAMQTDELLEKVRTNRTNLYLIELRNTPTQDLMPVLVSPADFITLSNLHRAEPQHP